MKTGDYDFSITISDNCKGKRNISFYYILIHCKQSEHTNSSMEIFFEGNPALLGNITLFNTKANWFNAYNEIRYVDRKYVFYSNLVVTWVGKHTLKVLAAVMQYLNSI